MNPITAGWIATAGHVLCATAFVVLVVRIMLRHEGKDNGRWFS